MLGVKSSLNIVGGEFFKFYKSNPIHKILVKACVKLPHTVVIGCENWKENFLKEFKPKNLALIHNPIIPTKNPKQSHKLHDGKVNFMFFGRLDAPKGVKDVIDTLRNLDKSVTDKMIFTFAGKGPMADYIRQEMSSEIADGDVELFENVSDEEKEQLMQKANVFVLPSHAEVLPISLLEAMSHKLPAIVTAVGGMPDAVVEGENGFLIKEVSTIATELPQHLQYFINNPEQIEPMGQASLNKVHKQFSFDVIFQKSVASFN
jgi:glycosyltransferase involved in cell wall biosynthesis